MGGIFCTIITVFFVFINKDGIKQELAYNFGNQKQETSLNKASFIYIPKIRLEAPLVKAKEQKSKDLQKLLLSGVVEIIGPNQNNIYIGHSSNYWWEESKYNNVFGLLDKLETGNIIIITKKNQKKKYSIYKKSVTHKNDPEIAKISNSEDITLVTCWPKGTNWKRLYIKAKPVK